MQLAWISYLPLPGLGLVAVLAAPEDPLARYHARQGSMLVGLALAALLALGLMANISDAAPYLATLGLLAGATLLAFIIAMGLGIAGVLRGRYNRIRPVWDVLAALGR